MHCFGYSLVTSTVCAELDPDAHMGCIRLPFLNRVWYGGARQRPHRTWLKTAVRGLFQAWLAQEERGGGGEEELIAGSMWAHLIWTLLWTSTLKPVILKLFAFYGSYTCALYMVHVLISWARGKHVSVHEDSRCGLACCPLLDKHVLALLLMEMTGGSFK
jgi:hypothetical protein